MMTRKGELLRSLVRDADERAGGPAAYVPSIVPARKAPALRVILLPGALVWAVAVFCGGSVRGLVLVTGPLLVLYVVEIALLFRLGRIRWLTAARWICPGCGTAHPQVEGAGRIRRRVLWSYLLLARALAVAGVFVALALVGRRAFEGRGRFEDFGLAHALLFGAAMAWFVRDPFLDG